jgi:hypothetical protein
MLQFFYNIFVNRTKVQKKYHLFKDNGIYVSYCEWLKNNIYLKDMVVVEVN